MLALAAMLGRQVVECSHGAWERLFAKYQIIVKTAVAMPPYIKLALRLSLTKTSRKVTEPDKKPSKCSYLPRKQQSAPAKSNIG